MLGTRPISKSNWREAGWCYWNRLKIKLWTMTWLKFSPQSSVVRFDIYRNFAGTHWNFQFIFDQSLHRTGQESFGSSGTSSVITEIFFRSINTTISIKLADKLGNMDSNLPARSDWHLIRVQLLQWSPDHCHLARFGSEHRAGSEHSNWAPFWVR